MSAIPGSRLVWMRLAFGAALGLSASALILMPGPMGMNGLLLTAGMVCLSLGWVVFETQIIKPLQELAQIKGDPVQALGTRFNRLQAERDKAEAQATVVMDQPVEAEANGMVPLEEMSKVLEVMTAGGTPQSHAELQPALDAFAQRIENFKTSLSCLSILAQNTLSDKRMPPDQGWFGEVGREVNEAMESMADRYVERTQGAARVAGVSAQILEEAEAFSARIEAQAAALQETAATMEEVSATVATNAESASEATKLSSSTAEIALRGRDVADKAVHGMRKIDESARKITEITSIVDGIAFQTNLLSLNAAVEAARAGEAGKGFAVVASEVRTLAQRAADAARSISELVAESTVHVSEGVTQVEATGSLLVEIQAGIEQVVNSISEISAATREQASGIGEISQTLSNLDGETQTNAALVTRTIANAHHLGDLAASLGAGTAKLSPSEPALDTTAKPTQDSVEDPWAVASQTPEEDQGQTDEELQTYVPRPSHNLPNRGPLTATALSVADKDGWEEF